MQSLTDAITKRGRLRSFLAPQQSVSSGLSVLCKAVSSQASPGRLEGGLRRDRCETGDCFGLSQKSGFTTSVSPCSNELLTCSPMMNGTAAELARWRAHLDIPRLRKLQLSSPQSWWPH